MLRLLLLGLLLCIPVLAAPPCVEPFVATVPATEARRLQAPGELRSVATVNLAEETRADRIASAIQGDARLRSADALLLQEALYVDGDPQTTVRAIALALGMHASFASTSPVRADGERLGLALLTRAPQQDVRAIPLERFDLRVRSRCRLALAATVQSGERAVRLINLHLDTRINAETRIRQLEPVIAEAERFEGPVVAAGDFNSTPLWWFEHLVPIPLAADQADVLLRAMASRGFETPQAQGGQATLPLPGLKLRLDWVFVRGLEPGDWGTARFEPSDHRAVWMDVRPVGEQLADDVEQVRTLSAGDLDRQLLRR